MYHRIRELREDRDLTQAYLAKILYMHTTQYQRYERGESETPLEVAIKIAQFYNVSLDYIAGLTDNPRTLDGSPYRVSKNINITQKGSGNNINIKN